MTLYPRLNKTVLIMLCYLVTPVVGLSQNKNILQRKTCVYPGIDFGFFLLSKPVVKLNLAVDYKVLKQGALGYQYSHTKFKSFPHIWVGSSGLETSSYDTKDTVIPIKRTGYTIGNANEIYIKFFRKKRDARYPIGKYMEIGLGIQNSRFTGYQYSKAEFDAELSKWVGATEVNEPERKLKTAFITTRFGKQWVLENGVLLTYGVSIKGHIPISPLDDKKFDERSGSLSDLTLYDIILIDGLTTFFRIGKMF